MKTVFGAALAIVSIAGFEWGAKIQAGGWDAAGQEVSREGLNVGALVLAYGLGLVPLLVGMLLIEAAYDYQRKWASVVALIPTFYAVTRWGALSNQLHKIHDKAYVPSVLLLVGVLGIAGWATSLWIRLRRAEVNDLLERRKQALFEEAKRGLAAERAARAEAERKAKETAGEGKPAELNAGESPVRQKPEEKTGEGTPEKAV